MQSIKIENNAFSMEDFEKGLMLAGYIMPNSTSEISEREELEKHETNLGNATRVTYFKRAVLAAEIAAQLHAEFTFGRVKFQKLVYLCEHVANMNLEYRYQKQAAGPFDNKFMHSIDAEFQKQKWFSVEKTFENNMKKFKYTPLPTLKNYKKYFDKYYANNNDKIQFIINLFRTRKTDYTELATTVFACYLELKGKRQEVNKTHLLTLFYDWSEKKKRFPENDVIASYTWLQENGLIPSVDFLE